MRRSLCIMAWILAICCLVGCCVPAGSDPTQEPTQLITEIPTEEPTVEPSATADATTAVPTGTPTQVPTKEPTNAPTVAPTVAPTKAPLIKEGMLTPGKAHVIIMSGQSNMVGRAQIRYLEQTATAKELSEYKAGYENIQIFYYVDHQNSDPTNIATEFVPVTLGQGSTTVQFGPEVGLAEYLNKTFPGEKFYLIKCAWSGAGLFNCFGAGQYHFTEILRRINVGINKLKDAGLDPEIFAFCWMQGESDSGNPDCREPYIGRYDALLKDLREAFTKYFAPDCRYIDAGISERWVDYEKMNEIKKNYADTHENCFFIDTVAAGLTTKNEPVENPDTAHYDCESTVRLGEMFGELITV